MPRYVRRLQQTHTRELDPAAFVAAPDASQFGYLSDQLHPRWPARNPGALIGYSQLDPRAFGLAAVAGELSWMSHNPVVRWRHDPRPAIARLADGFVGPWAQPGAYYCNPSVGLTYEGTISVSPTYITRISIAPAA